jgi:hypothetical protein
MVDFGLVTYSAHLKEEEVEGTGVLVEVAVTEA